jgi:UDP-N-acetylmuramate dehydrogenase
MFESRLSHDVPLAAHTTLDLGGPARHFIVAEDEATIRDAVAWSRDRDVPLFVLGEGSNVVVSDRGFDGLVLRIATRGIDVRHEGTAVRVTVAAGERWDPFVARTVSEGFAGVECLSGIPGLVGATPIQNVGAYGQEVSDTLESVRTLDRLTLETGERSAAECEFGYRDSAFRRDATRRRVVLAVTYVLRPGGDPTVRYGELVRALRDRALDRPSLSDVRETVLTLRRRKSMVLDPVDENRRSVGSFFTNPIVSTAQRDDVVARALAAGLVRHADEVPQYPAPGGGTKLAAAWLIERSGVSRGQRHGRFGISTRHALALVHHGGGRSADLLALADSVRDAVRARFGVTLELEPVRVGF